MEKMKYPRVSITTSIGSDSWNLAKENDISWTDALEFGIEFLVADKDPYSNDYPKNNLSNKMQKIIEHRNALLIEIEDLKQGIKPLSVIEQTQKDIDDVLEKEEVKE